MPPGGGCRRARQHRLLRDAQAADRTERRRHFVKATGQVRRYADGLIGVFYGPRCIGRYGLDGGSVQTQTRVARHAPTPAGFDRGHALPN